MISRLITASCPDERRVLRLREPRVRLDHLKRDPVLGILAEHFLQEIDQLRRHERGVFDFGHKNLLEAGQPLSLQMSATCEYGRPFTISGDAYAGEQHAVLNFGLISEN
jgi:hypothetical protein